MLAVLSWLVRTRRVSPFSVVGRGMRRLTDPVINPIERVVVRRGGNPVQAGWWLVIIAAVIGAVTLGIAQWGIGTWYSISDAVQKGPRDMLRTAVDLVYYVLIIALFIRVIGSWLGYLRYTRWMRPMYWLTDWIVEPLRRVLPPMSQIDFSPLVAWLVLMALRWFVEQVLL